MPNLNQADIERAQRETLETAKWLSDQSKICNCVDCHAVNYRARARALVEVLLYSFEYLGQRTNPLYMPARRLHCEVSAEYPSCASGNGFAMPAATRTARPGPCSRRSPQSAV